MDDIILKAEHLQYSYDDGQTYALKDLTVAIPRGKKLAVMGANGSGKSTFFLCCNGILKPTGGTLYFQGKPVSYGRKGLLDLRSEVGIVFQDPNHQLFSANVYQEISFGILNLGATEEEATQAVEQVMEELEITPFAQRPTHTLSGGQKKLVSIADILVMNPSLMILDEPTASLDPKHTKVINQVVDTLTQKGITVMMATHDVDYAFSWADEVLLLHEGRLLRQGTPTELFSDPSLLEQAHLTQPTILKIATHLKAKGLLRKDAPVPTHLEDLWAMIEKSSPL